MIKLEGPDDIARCTQCEEVDKVGLRGDLMVGVPYVLCQFCFGIYKSLDDEGLESFRAELQQKAYLEHLPAAGRA